MVAQEFRDDDAGYLSWLAAHPEGYVANIQKRYNPADARMHRASCSALRSRASAQTGDYVKVCADRLADLATWAINHVGQEIQHCARCKALPPLARAAPMAYTPIVSSAPQIAGRFLLPSPAPGSAAVEAWADDYIQHKPRPAWQSLLCSEINAWCANVKPSADEVLHASYFGYKPPRMDIENLSLYNVGSFTQPGCHGIRFEHGAAVPAAPDGQLYQVGYRYALVPRSASFADWQMGRTLASFGWTDLVDLRRIKVLAQVWLALARRRGGAPEPALTSGTSFAVKVKVRPPYGQSSGLNADLVKGIIDGVVSAFQAHTDASTSGEVAARLANVLPANPAEIEHLLLERRWAVLGSVPHLVYLRGSAVQWNPGDDWCDAGELLPAEPEPADTDWAISGQIVELSRWQNLSGAPPGRFS